MMRGLFLKLLRRKRLARDLDTELAFHLEMSVRQQNAVGLGNTSLVKERGLRSLAVQRRWEPVARPVPRSARLAGRPALVMSALLSLGLGKAVAK